MVIEGILNPLNNIQKKKNTLMSNSMSETSYHQPPPTKKNLETTEQNLHFGSTYLKISLGTQGSTVGWFALFGWNSTHLCFVIAQDLFIKPNL